MTRVNSDEGAQPVPHFSLQLDVHVFRHSAVLVSVGFVRDG